MILLLIRLFSCLLLKITLKNFSPKWARFDFAKVLPDFGNSCSNCFLNANLIGYDSSQRMGSRLFRAWRTQSWQLAPFTELAIIWGKNSLSQIGGFVCELSDAWNFSEPVGTQNGYTQKVNPSTFIPNVKNNFTDFLTSLLCFSALSSKCHVK